MRQLPPEHALPDLRPVVGIVFHHTECRDGIDLGTDNILAYHLSQGWQDIGYDFVAERVEDWRGVIFGRPLTMDGAHCRAQGANRRTIGFAFNGNFDEAAPDPVLLDAAVPTIRWLMQLYHLRENDLYCHRDLADTSCPGRYFDLDAHVIMRI